MEGNFKFAKRFSTGLAKHTYQNVFFDRFNSVKKGFYLVVSEQHAVYCMQNRKQPMFVKLPSTERFGSQDVTIYDQPNPEEITDERRKAIFFLKEAISTNNYTTIFEK